jgi:hypothetical protein
MKKIILSALVCFIGAFNLVSCAGTGNDSPVAASSSKTITAYSFSNPAAIGNINESDKTISFTVPYGTDITGLIASFTTTGASVKLNGTVQVSGITTNDFTNPIIYTVTAGDGSTSQYTVTVTVAISSAKSMMSFTILGISGAINESAKTITLSVPHGTDITGLVATFTTTGASVKVDGIVQASGITANDFTNPIIYTVTAADSSTADYTVTVKARSLPEREWVQRYSNTTSDVDWDQPTAIAVDAAGNVYVTGGGMDVALGQSTGYATMKYDTHGNQLWLQRYAARDWARAIALDSSGNVYVTGQPATIKYNSAGTPVWIKSYGYNDIRGIAMKIDGSDNIYVTGWKMNSENKNDAVTIKYAADGTELWVRTHHETGRYLAFKSLVLDSSGNVYAVGFSAAADGSDYKYVVAKYDATGTELWTTHFDGATAFVSSENISLAVDLQGDIYIGGGIVEPDSDALSSDFGLIKYDKDGNQLWMSRYNGPGNYIDYASGIALDSQGNIIVTGFSWGINVDWDFTTIKYDTSGNQLWVRRFNSGRDSAQAIAIDQMDNVYVTGGIWGPLGFATIKYDTNGNQAWIAFYGGPAEAEGWATAIALDISGNVYITGYSKGAGTNYDFATIKYTQ